MLTLLKTYALSLRPDNLVADSEIKTEEEPVLFGFRTFLSHLSHIHFGCLTLKNVRNPNSLTKEPLSNVRNLNVFGFRNLNETYRRANSKITFIGLLRPGRYNISK